MKLNALMDVNKLADHCNNHVVNVQHHRYAPLAIYNYGQKAQFDGIWDEITCQTRGLIVDQSTDDVVARPFRKFFNLNTEWWPETKVENLPPAIPEVTEKLDGSLGIFYQYGGMHGIATRGSFHSDQAGWATAWYGKNLANASWPEGWTPLFEIIYPDNRIVVKYDWQGLALLSLVNIETGQEMSHDEVTWVGKQNGCRVVPLFHMNLADVRAAEAPNAEGYVLTWHNGPHPPLKIKFKFIEYCRLHRLLTTISPKAIWEMLRDGMSFNELYDNTPSHYQEWVNYWKNGLEAEYGKVEQKAKAIYASCHLPKDGKDKTCRKALAAFFTMGDRKIVSTILFTMLDGLPYDGAIWKIVREKTRDEEPFRREE